MSSVARRAWTVFEPLHACAYFAPETADQLRETGLRGRWMGYFASRSAPMGAVSSAVVVATFHNFPAHLVQRAIPDAWAFASPERVIAARWAGVDAALRRMLDQQAGSAEVEECARLILDVTENLECGGRPLSAAHAALAVPEAPHLRVWHGCTLLREHRFDGHIAALVAHGVDGLEALITAAADKGLDPEFLRGFRGWTEEQWAAGTERLRDRGLLDNAGRLTPEGQQLRHGVEEMTDRLAAPVWEQTEAPMRDRLIELLGALCQRVAAAGGFAYPNPVGVPPPASA